MQIIRQTLSTGHYQQYIVGNQQCTAQQSKMGKDYYQEGNMFRLIPEWDVHDFSNWLFLKHG